MKRELVKIIYCFPSLLESKGFNSKKYAEAVLQQMHQEKSIDYNGYLTDNDVTTDLSKRVGVLNSKNYLIPDKKLKAKLNKLINDALMLAYKTLPHPEVPVFIFIYPWIPTAQDQKLFNGVTGVTRHSRVMQLFINISDFSEKHIKRSVIHEYNHLVYFNTHYTEPYTLKDHVVVEGLAVLFREEVFGGPKSPWIQALSKMEANKIYKELGEKLKSTDHKDYRDLFFGSKKFKRWSGYSIGYNMVKKFRKNNPNISWGKLINLTGKDIGPN